MSVQFASINVSLKLSVKDNVLQFVQILFIIFPNK